MTAVLATSISRVPVIVGDILISGPEISGRATYIPTVGSRENVFPGGSEWVPLQLCQKTIIVGPNLMVGWSGSMIGARSILRDLEGLCQQGALDRLTLTAFLKLNEAEMHQIGTQLAGFLRDSHGVSSFVIGGDRYPDSVFREVMALGSGAVDVVKLLQAQDWSAVMKNGDPLRAAIGGTMMLAGQLLAAEVMTHGTLTQYYGGGYEIALLMGDEFKKIPEHTHVLWQVQLGSTDGRVMPTHAFKSCYVGDALHVRALIPSTLQGRKSPLFNNAGYLVSSPLCRVSPEESIDLAMPDMNSVLTCHHFIVSKGEQRPATIFSKLFYMPSSADRSFNFLDTSSGAEIVFSDDFIQPILDSISKIISENNQNIASS